MRYLNRIFNSVRENKLIVNKVKLLSHIIIWIIITIFFSIIDPVKHGWVTVFLATAFIMFTYIFTYYLNYIISFPIFFSGYKFPAIVLMILCFGVCLIIHYYVDFIILLAPNETVIADFGWISRKFFVYVITFTVSLGFYENKKGMIAFRDQIQKEKVYVDQELGFYKNQFNHHISFNFLNYCYSYALKKSDNTAHIISTYSEMMRYTLDSSSDQTMPLIQELQYINQYIEVQRQFIPNLSIQFNSFGILEGKQILPRILITFVENAFKHGITDDIERPIQIDLNVKDKNLEFSVMNSKRINKDKIVSTGIGQYNAKGQLDLFYNKKYNLNILETENSYTSILTLHFK
jgi:two-component system, LytTR family, sensor kinase